MKNMKSFILLLLAGLFCTQANALVSVTKSSGTLNELVSVNAGNPNANLQLLLNLTPEKYEQLTGKHMGFMSKMALKLAQKKAKASLKATNVSDSGLPQVAYIVLAIVGLGFLGVGLVSDWKGNDWWITLLLSFLFWLPGVIYALVVMNKYY